MTPKLIAFGVVAFVVSLIITVPAQLAGPYLLPAHVHAAGLEGTVWQGKANRLQVWGFDLGAVSWDLQPLALFLGRLQSEVSIDRPDLQGQGTIAVGLGTFRFVNMHMTGQAEVLAPLLIAYGVSIDGSLEANIQTVEVTDRGPQAADGAIMWREARLVRPVALALGDVNVTVRQDGDKAVADLKNTGDTLHLAGGARLQPDWKYDARLRIEPTDTTPKDVRNTLALLGRPDPNGAITLSQQGTLFPVLAGAE
ncbi:MAG TPA: type II secretion system protein N [Gammaproteobacteria bacterium]|nr:type II secretion system protein N [Gammaproteobacteria bacterium]